MIVGNRSCYCLECATTKSSDGSWAYEQDTWMHEHANGKKHKGVWLTPAQAKKKFGDKLDKSDDSRELDMGNSSIMLD